MLRGLDVSKLESSDSSKLHHRTDHLTYIVCILAQFEGFNSLQVTDKIFPLKDHIRTPSRGY